MLELSFLTNALLVRNKSENLLRRKFSATASLEIREDLKLKVSPVTIVQSISFSLPHFSGTKYSLIRIFG